MYGNFVHATNDANHYATPPTKSSTPAVMMVLMSTIDGKSYQFRVVSVI